MMENVTFLDDAQRHNELGGTKQLKPLHAKNGKAATEQQATAHSTRSSSSQHQQSSNSNSSNRGSSSNGKTKFTGKEIKQDEDVETHRVGLASK